MQLQTLKPGVVAISGQSGAGKSVLARALQGLHTNVDQFAFGDAVRDALLLALVVRTALPPHMPFRWVAQLARLVPSAAFLRWLLRRKPTPRVVRVWLQWWGHDYGRAADPEIWIRRVTPKVAISVHWHHVAVVDDVRYPDELAALRAVAARMGVPFVHVHLPDREVTSTHAHASETQPLPVAHLAPLPGWVPADVARQILDAEFVDHGGPQ